MEETKAAIEIKSDPTALRFLMMAVTDRGCPSGRNGDEAHKTGPVIFKSGAANMHASDASAMGTRTSSSMQKVQEMLYKPHTKLPKLEDRQNSSSPKL